MTFAQWEREVRMIDDTIVIHTECDHTGQVVRAWTAGGFEWRVEDSE